MKIRNRAKRNRDRGYLLSGLFVLLVSGFIGYYGFIAIKCVSHFNALIEDKVQTINFNIDGR